MPNVFTPRVNLLARASIVGFVILLATAGVFAYGYMYSSFSTGVGIEVDQPVPFSHQHHVGAIGIDCRYCHTTVEDSAFAGMPSTQTCMNCHSRLWTDAPMLEPIRESWRTGTPIRWQRVHVLPDHVYFNHSIHVAKGIGCVTCHGRVDQMGLVRKEVALHMRWCLDCHRDPKEFVRPKDKLLDMAWRPAADDEADRDALFDQYNIRLMAMTDCSTCHR